MGIGDGNISMDPVYPNQEEADSLLADYVRCSTSQAEVLRGRECGKSPMGGHKAVEILNRPAVYVEVTGETSAHLEFLNMTPESMKIVTEHLPDIMERFMSKNVDYQDFALADLGPRAHFVGLWRKVGKLKRALWDGEKLQHEGTVEVLDDLFGHLLLARSGLKG
jgi:hypothetical protein